MSTVAFSPDGSLVLTGGESTVRLWDRDRAALVRWFRADGVVTAASFSPGGARVLAGTRSGTVHLWDATTGVRIHALQYREGILSTAFSPDGRRIVAGGADGAAVVWDAETGGEILRLEGSAGWVNSVRFSPDGRRILTGHGDTLAILWDAGSGTELRRLEGHSAGVIRAVFSPDGERMLTGDGNGRVVLRDAETGHVVRTLLDGGAAVHAAAFSPRGDRVLLGRWDGSAIVIDVATGQEERRLLDGGPSVWAVAVSPDGGHALTGTPDGVAREWDVASGRMVRRYTSIGSPVTAVDFSRTGDGILTGDMAGSVRFWTLGRRDGGEVTRMTLPHADSGGAHEVVESVAFSPDGRRALTASRAASAPRLWDVRSGRPLQGYDLPATYVAFSPDGGSVLLGSRREARIVDVASGREEQVLPTGWVYAADFSPDGGLLLTDGPGLATRLWDLATGREERGFPAESGPRPSVAFSPAGGLLVTTDGWDGTQRWGASAWDPQTGRQLRRFDGPEGPLRAVSLSGDGRTLVGASEDWNVWVWNVGTGRTRALLSGHTGVVGAASVSSDGRWVVSGSADGTTRLWDLDTGEGAATLIGLDDGIWAVVTPDGRFDTNDPEGIRGLSWVVADDPMTALPVEIFMRDYYEPRLLPRILEGEDFPAIEGLGERNRVQAEVRVAAVDAAGDGTATVTVEVEAAERYFGTGSDSTLVRSGGADLRLFRDGQLVGWADGPLDTRPGRPATFTFGDVRLPRTGTDSVTFSAYAFNENYTSSDGSEWIGRVKSATDYRAVAVPENLGRRPGRAYLVTVGVDAYESPAWDLRFAANDARVLGRELTERLEEADFADVVHVPLLSDQDPTESTVATRAAIQGVLDLLAGRDVSAETLSRIPNADRIHAATPEDLVLISFSGHGYTGPDGVFYMFPADIGEGRGREVTEELLARTVSSDDLTGWLRDIDAGEMVLIVDACHSAAAVEGAGFKPGPMGSRGLGQLAYDKGMRVLAASQAADVALESDVLRQGLLTYALVQDGLEAGQADHEPADGRITLDEWLRYATERVPALYREVLDGEVQTFGRGLEIEAEGGEDELFQRPSLFDFRRSGEPVLLEGIRESGGG